MLHSLSRGRLPELLSLNRLLAADLPSDLVAAGCLRSASSAPVALSNSTSMCCERILPSAFSLPRGSRLKTDEPIPEHSDCCGDPPNGPAAPADDALATTSVAALRGWAKGIGQGAIRCTSRPASWRAHVGDSSYPIWRSIRVARICLGVQRLVLMDRTGSTCEHRVSQSSRCTRSLLRHDPLQGCES